MSPSEQAETVDRTAATDVGGLLKASRLRIGEDLRDIADILKIRYVYLEAIEDGRFGDLPGATYSLGFIRTYAEHLGLDSDEVIRRFKDQFSEEASEIDLVFPEPIPEIGIPGGAIVFIGLLVAVLAYGVWYVNTSEDGFIAELISPVPERLARQDSINKPADKTADKPAEAPGNKSEDKSGDKSADSPSSGPSSAPKEAAESQTPASEAAPQAQSGETPSSEAALVEAVPVEIFPAETSPAETASPATPLAETPSSEPAPAEKAVSDSARIEAIVAEVVQDLASAAEIASAPKPAPESAAEPTPEPVPAEASPAPEPVSGPSVVPIDMIPPPAASLTTPGEPAAAETPAAETAALTAAPAPPSTPESQAATPSTTMPGKAKEKGRIVVRAKMNSWIQVRDDTVNELLFTRMLRVGDSYAVPGRPGLKLSTGNAGALEILVDGEPVPSIGGEGTVRRNVFLDAERLKAGTAVGE